MNPFTRFSLNNGVVMALLVVLLTAGGIFYGSSLQMETMPNVNLPILTVATIYPGASPEDVSKTISGPLQKAIAGVQGLKQVDATSNENISLIIAQFDFSKSSQTAQREIQEAVDRVTIPEKARKPIVSRIRMNSLPVLSYSVSGKEGEDKLASAVNDRLRPALTGIAGVSSVSVDGLRDNKVFIRVKADKLKQSNLTLQDLQTALGSANIAFPAGTAEIRGESLPIKISGQTRSLDDLKSIPILAMPNVAQMTGEAMAKISGAIAGVYGTMADMGTGMKKLGEATAKSMQAVAMLAQIQQSQASALAQARVLANPQASPEDRAKAQQALDMAALVGKAAGSKLSELFAGMSASSDASATPMARPGAGAAVPMGAASASAGAPAVRVLFLGDVADVTVGKPDSTSMTRANMAAAVLVNVYKNDDANTVTVADAVSKEVKAVAKANSGIRVTEVSDSSKAVKDSVFGMLREGLLGALFAVLVIALFLRNAKATVISVISIPLSILIALILMPRFNITLNSISLAGMAVAVGRIVDDSIVVIENIHRRLQKQHLGGIGLIGEAVSEVAAAITASTATTVAVFAPLAFVSGMVGQFFKPFAITVVICILASLLVAVTVVPVLSRLMLSDKAPKHRAKNGGLADAYKAVLEWALAHKGRVVTISVALFATSLALLPLVGVQFMPSSGGAVLSARLDMPAGTSLGKTNSEVMAFEKYLLKDSSVRNEVSRVLSSVGDTSGNGGFMAQLQGKNQAKLTITLKDAATADAFTAKAKKHLASSSTGKWTMAAVSGMGPGNETIEVLITGDNMADIRAASHLVAADMQKSSSVTNVTNNLSVTKPEVAVRVDSARAAAKGLSTIMVAGTVRSALSMDKVATLQVDGDDLDVMMGYDRKTIGSLESVKNLRVRGMSGEVALSEVADVVLQDGPASISERGGTRNATVSADIVGKNTMKATNDIKARLGALQDSFRPGVVYSVGGSMGDITEGFSQMGMAMLAAIVLVFITMLLGLREVQAAFAILCSLPFAAVGALLALVATGTALSMSGLVGILMLIGIVVTNAIVLMDRVLTNKAKGLSTHDALLEAGSVRLRPILMTAAATVMALLPMALGLSKDAFIGKEVGVVVIGGLVMSTLLTLVIVPVAYTLMTKPRGGRAATPTTAV